MERMFPPTNSNGDARQSSGVPKWETAILVGSFVLVWAWFIARQRALGAEEALAPGWNIALLVAVALLVWVFVRRLTRVVRALRENNPAQRRNRN
jgi:type VI protein secretion system component VasK